MTKLLALTGIQNLPAVWKTQVQFLGQEDPLEKGMATHSSMLAWRIPWTEEPGGLQSMWSQRVRACTHTNKAGTAHACTHTQNFKRENSWHQEAATSCSVKLPPSKIYVISSSKHILHHEILWASLKERGSPYTFTVIILESSLCFQIPGEYCS